MEFISSNKKGSEPIHARKGKLTPISLKPKRPPESKTRIESSPKNYDLPRINTLDCNELTQYMSCGGIKLSIRLNLSVEKRRKKKIDLHQAGSLVKTYKAGAFTAPTATFQLGALGVIQHKKILNLRQSKIIENPQELKYIFRIAQVKEESLILTRQTTKQLFAFYIPQKTYVTLHPCEQSLHYPSPHPYLMNPIGITEIASIQKKFYIFKNYDDQSIAKFINQFGAINVRLVRTYIGQLVESVSHLHLNGYRHNRLNLNSLMHNGEGKILINWLKAAKGPISQKEKHRYFYYFPPQALLSRNYNDSQKNDIWAIGSIALQLLSSEPIESTFLHPYNRSTAGYMSESTDILKKVQNLMVMLGLPLCDEVDRTEQNISVLGVQFVAMCLTVCIDRRASILELLRHPFLSK